MRGLGAEAKGTLYMIGGGVLLTAQDAITKWLTSDYHVGEIMAYRGVFMLLPVLAAIAMTRDFSFARPKRPLGVGLRAMFMLITSVFVVLSFREIPLAEALAIIFLSPLLVTALSAPLLGEAVGWRRWSAVLTGFAGMLLITGPGGSDFPLWAVVFPLCGAVFASLRDITTRRVGMLDTTLCLLFWSVLASVMGGLVTLPFGTHWPALADWGLFASAGLLAALSHFMTIRAFQIARAATVSPFKYLSLIWAAVFGYLLWGDLPGPMQVAGAALVAGSGLYILYRETVIARRARVVAHAGQ